MRASLSLTFVALAACAGNAPGDQHTGDDQDAGVDAGPDAPPADMGQKISGKALDYFTTLPIDDVAMETDGIDPKKTTTSAGGGLYTFEAVPTGSKLYFSSTKANYRATRTQAIAVADQPVVQDIQVVAVGDVNRQYTTTGAAAVANTGFVAAELKKNDGTPFEGLAIATAITLVDANDTAIAGVKIFGVGAAGDVLPTDPMVAASTTTTAFGGKARVFLLDVPAGAATLKVSYLDALNNAQTLTAPVITTANGASVIIVGGSPTDPAAAITNPKFTTDIYPRLQKAGAGGLGCANCHTLGGQAAVLQYDLGAAATLDAIKAAGVLVTTPGIEATSKFLTYPLYEPAPVNHVNATFLDINDANYKLFLLWITQGALI
ncbi:MAG TPA: hypothetical protein VGM90_31910 [Kofleriaceae bacterium]|jgi:hypothetical protein